MASIQRFDVQVIAIDAGRDRWSVRVTLSDADGKVVKHAAVSDCLFATRGEAELAGWRIADGWLDALRQDAAA